MKVVAARGACSSLLAAVLVLSAATPSAALVLCKKKSGILRLRDACTPRESLVDAFGLASSLGCSPDAVRVGTACVDRYEASAWQIPAGATDVIAKVQAGTATVADLTGAGAVQLGCTGAPFNHTAYPGTFPTTGN
jgi:hypothetical protein